MRKIIFCLMMMFVFTATPVHGGVGHDDYDHDHAVELSKSRILEKASGFVATIIEKGRLDASWARVKPTKAEKNNRHEWVVTFFNPEIKDREKQTMYLFLTLSGEYIAANFSGK